MTKRFVKFSSLFAVVAMLLGLMVTACSEGNNTVAKMGGDATAASLLVSVEKAATSGKALPAGVNSMVLEFYGDKDTPVTKLFKSQDYKIDTGNWQDWTETSTDIFMDVDFTEDEVAQNLDHVAITAYEGSEVKGHYYNYCGVIKAGDNGEMTVGKDQWTDDAAVLAVVVDKVPVNGNFPEGVDRIDLTFDNGNIDDILVKTFASKTSSITGCEYWVENDDAILMTPTFTDEEIAKNYKNLIILAYKGGDVVASAYADVAIEKGVTSVEIASDAWSDYVALLVTTVNFTKSASDTKFIRVAAVDVNGNEVAAKVFGPETEGTVVTKWHENEDGSVSMPMYLTDTQIAKEPVVVFAGCTDQGLNVLGGYFGKENFDEPIINADLSDATFHDIGTSKGELKVVGAPLEVTVGETIPVQVLLELQDSEGVKVNVDVSNCVDLQVDSAYTQYVDVVEEAALPTLKGKAVNDGNEVRASLTDSKYVDFTVNVVAAE